MDTIRIETLGCRLNQIESEATARFFIDNGFSVCMEGITANTDENPEIIIAIINTCTVTQKAEQKARRIIRLMLKKCPNALVIVTGCYAQVANEEIKKIDNRICVIGGQIKSRIAEVPILLKEWANDNWNALAFGEYLNKKLIEIPPMKTGFPEDSFKLSTSSFLAHSRASLKIQDGCNNNCSYCAIHLARGHSVSIDVETAVRRVQDLEKWGQDEVVITTVNIAQYKGKYKDGYCNFAQLLKILLENTTKINFRISSLYPEIVDDEFCKVIADSRVRPHFHISVQSGSDKILSTMNRQYKADDVIKACQKLQSAKDNPFLACDIITGFPGETKEDFADTLSLCEQCGFAWVHAFPYSERPGTPAATMKNKVPQSVSGERAKRLTDWAINNKINYLNRFVGKELSAILETVKRPGGVIKADKYIYHAVTENFIHCEIVSDAVLEVNKTVKVRVEKVLTDRILKGGDIEVEGKII